MTPVPFFQPWQINLLMKASHWLPLAIYDRLMARLALANAEVTSDETV